MVLLRIGLTASAFLKHPMLMLRVPLQARRMDHFERAKREEEAPLILAAHTQRLQVRVYMCRFRYADCLSGPAIVAMRDVLL